MRNIRQFLRKNPNSLLIQSKYFEELLNDKNIIALVLSDKSGFVTGRIITPQVFMMLG